MGGSFSKTNTEIVNESIISAVIESSQNTLAYTKATQSTSLSGTNILIFNTQKVETSIAALKSVIVDNKLIDHIVQNIKNKAKAEGTLLQPAAASSDIKIRNIISAHFTTRTLQSCVAGVEAAQTLESKAGSVNIMVMQSQNIEQLSRCTTIMDISNKISKDVLQDVKNKSEAESESILGMLAKGYIVYLVFIGLIVLIIIGVIIKSATGKKKKKNRQRFRRGFAQYRPRN